MPKLSAFTPCGLLRMTSAPSKARVIYDAKVRALGADQSSPAYASTADGSRLQARLYAESIREGIIRMLLERGGEADFPDKIHPELVPIREVEYGITPAYGDTMALRKRSLQAAYRLPSGGDRYSIENTLRALLGTGFVYYRTIHPSERVLWPTTIGASPMNLQPPNARRVLIRVDPVNGLPLPSATPQQVVFVPLLPNTPSFQVGDRLVLEPEICARAEVVTVLATGGTASAPWFEAVVLNAHEPNAFGTTSPFPLWLTNQRSALIVVAPAVAADPNQVRRIHIVMQQLARSVSTWAITAATSSSTTGPFLLGVSPLGYTTLGTVSFP